MSIRKTWLLVTLFEILFFIAAFLLGVSIKLKVPTKHATTSKLQCQNLKIWYDEYNLIYFGGSLPRNVEVDYGEYSDEDIATTTQLPDGRFHIAMNEKYTASGRVAHLFLLHEMCHVETWKEGATHGPQWRTCMLAIDWQGAHRNLLIDGYNEQK